MNNTPAQILANFLFNYSPSGEYPFFTDPVENPGKTWPLYISEMPDEKPGVPMQVGAIYDPEGRVIAGLLASGKKVQSFGIQIKLRSNDYTDSFAYLTQVCEYLAAVKMHPVAVGGNSYTIDTVRQTSNVMSMGQDEKRRALVSVNFLMMLFGY